MAAYILVDITIHDSQTYERYKLLAPASIAAYGGKYLVRGGRTERLEGDWQPSRLVILEFPGVADAKAWWESEEYAAAKALRQSCTTTDMLLVEGFPGG
jgi:uncharacterized protein (DUF1330 family)